jgi:UDP-N-acetylmuramoyl-tripeptide--D-alanyl-D-alanine ligase
MNNFLCLQDLANFFNQQIKRGSSTLDPATLNWEFENVCTDSRALQPGDLFIPLRGERFDGHNFLEAAVAVGVAGALVATGWHGDLPDQLAYLPVIDTTEAYQKIALLWRRRLQIPVIAVTGSAGKTTTRELIKACVQQLGAVEASIGNENNDIGVPRTILRARPPLGALVLEMGMRGLGEIERLSRCAEPSVAVITNIGTAHIGRLGSREAIAQAKCEITAALNPAGLLVIPAGDQLLEMALSKVWQGRVMRVALSNDNLSENTPCPDLIAELNAEATKMQLKHQSITLDLPLSGNHNARNLLLALAVANELSIDFNSLTNLDVILPEGRAKTIKLEGRLSGVTVHDETYNASPEAVLASLDLLSQQPGRRFALLGTMLELGEQSEILHKQIGMKAAALGIDGLIVLADALESKALMEGAKDIKLIYSVNSVDEAAKKLHSLLKSGDYLLLKASRAVALEKIIPLLQD